MNMNQLFYSVDLPKETKENNNFRKVAWTGRHSTSSWAGTVGDRLGR